jgi:hypothetical protein
MPNLLNGVPGLIDGLEVSLKTGISENFGPSAMIKQQ